MSESHQPPEPGKPRREPVSSDKLYEILAGEAVGFYQLIVATATAFLAGSLIFLEKLVPSPTILAIVLLCVGWLSLIAAIVVVGEVRLTNLESLRLAMEGRYEDAKPYDVRNRKTTMRAQLLLFAGMLFVMFGGLVGLSTRERPSGGSPSELKVQIDKVAPISIIQGNPTAVDSGSSKENRGVGH